MKKERKNERSSPPEALQRLVLTYLEERFGLAPALFEDFGFYLASKGRVYLGPKNFIGVSGIVTVGILVARVSKTVKPSTNLLQAFGHYVTRNFVELDREQTTAYAKGKDIMLSERQICSVSDGYVLLRYKNFPLGCGLCKGNLVRNMLPKAKRLMLKYL